MSGLKISKADLVDLAAALGVGGIDKGDPIRAIYLRVLDRARELGAPASLYPFGSDVRHPIVRDWARRVVDAAVEHVSSCRMGDDEAERAAGCWMDSAVRRQADIDPAQCSHTMKLGRCIRCGFRGPLRALLDAPEPCPGRFRGDGRQPGPCEPWAQDQGICVFCGRPIITASDVRAADPPAPEPRDEDGAESCNDLVDVPRDEDGAPMDMRPDPDREADELSHLRPAAHVDRVRALLEERVSR